MSSFQRQDDEPLDYEDDGMHDEEHDLPRSFRYDSSATGVDQGVQPSTSGRGQVDPSQDQAQVQPTVQPLGSISAQGQDNIRLLNTMTRYLDSKFKELKREIVDEQQHLSNNLEKRLKVTDYTFRRKGNKLQFEHNVQVNGHMEDAKEFLVKRPPVVKKAVDSLSAGILMIARRNKEIVMADSSDAGWSTVQEYNLKEVASDSEDDKRIRRAETNAARKLWQQRRRQFTPRGRGRVSYTGYSFREYYGKDRFPNNAQRAYYTGRGASGPQPTDICYRCGEPGHWQRACNGGRSAPSAAAGAANSA